MLDNRRFTAIGLLEKAIALDPNSFELHYSLGRAQLQPGSPTDQAAESFERAARLDPTNVDVRVQLARLYLTGAHAAKAIDHLRLAMQTESYRRNDDSAALVDLLLARALQQKGYHRAALDQYAQLTSRLQHAGPSIRSNTELLYLSNRPEILLSQIGQLHENLGNHDSAMVAYDRALRSDPANFELYGRIVRLLSTMKRWDDATSRAAEAVRMFHASNESLGLLRDVYQRMGRQDAMADELARLHAERPADRALTYALADVLYSQGKTADAQAVLARELEPQRYDLELVRRLFRLYQQNAQVEDAARLLIESMAANPDSLRETASLWDEILRFSQKNRLRLSTLQKLDVSPSAQAAKLYWVSRVAEMWNRDQLSRSSLEQAVRLAPPLAPAFRGRLGQIWSDPGATDDAKVRASEELIRSADSQDHPALAAELRGLLHLRQKDAGRAAAAFDEAMRAGRPSIDLQLNYASALFQQGLTARAEEALWKLVGDNPTFDEAYELLFQYYLNQNAGQQALKVLQAWAGADPTSVSARLVQANVMRQAKRTEQAEQILLPLFEQYPDNAEVLNSMQYLFASTGRLDQYIAKLEAERTRRPQNRVAAEQLARIYAEQKRTAEAARVLDSMKSLAAADVDLLYYVSHLYNSIGQKQTGERTLEDCLMLDPGYSPAANDLGYTWADQGKNLAKAESLIRMAVEAEPDNQTYLDSLGWVLYKKGQFEDAARYLRQAVDAAVRPDPIVLDHYGDALYRLGRHDEAVRQWKRSDEQMGAEPPGREDLQGLKLQLQQKLKQADKGGSVEVAPLGEKVPAPAVQAKN